VKTYHTSQEMEGQIYIPAVNYFLMVAVIGVCLGFKTSVALGSAFGMAVTFDMVFTSFFFVNVMYFNWHSSWWKIFGYSIIFWVIDFGFFASNCKKIPDGAWLPICIAIVLSSIMIIWHLGNVRLAAAAKEKSPSIVDIVRSIQTNTTRVPGVGFFFSPTEGTISPGIWSLVTNLRTLPKRAVLLQVRFVPVPFVSPTSPICATALDIQNLDHGLYQVVATFGYAQSKVYADQIADDVCKELDRLEGGSLTSLSVTTPTTAQSENFEISVDPHSPTLYFVCREYISSKKGTSRIQRLFLKAFNFLAKNAPDIVESYHIPPQALIEIGARFEV